MKNSIDSYIQLYTKTAESYITKILEKKSLLYLDIQVYIERGRNSSINTINKRIRECFRVIISKFLEDNYYYAAQKYLIFHFIKDFIELLSEKIGDNIYKKINDFLTESETTKNYKKFMHRYIQNFDQK